MTYFGSDSAAIKAESIAMKKCYKHQILMHQKVLPEGYSSTCKKGGVFEVQAPQKSGLLDGWSFGAAKQPSQANCIQPGEIQQLVLIGEPNLLHQQSLDLEYYSCMKSAYNVAIGVYHHELLLIGIPLVISYLFAYWLTAKLRSTLTVLKGSLILLSTIAIVNYYLYYIYYIGTLQLCDFLY
jgi:hypothetical protein